MVMLKIIMLVLLWVPCAAWGASQCQIVEYSDHFEATCIGKGEQAPALSQTIETVQVEWAQTAPTAQLSDSEPPQLSDQELPDIAPEHIVRNDLARLHGDYWLKTLARR
jgi:hypothetical protein